MDQKSDAKLRNEIQYLTRLIAAHKAIKALQSTEEPATPTIPSVPGTKGKRGNNKLYFKNVSAPSWTHSGSISSHLPCSSSSNSFNPLFSKIDQSDASPSHSRGLDQSNRRSVTPSHDPKPSKAESVNISSQISEKLIDQNESSMDVSLMDISTSSNCGNPAGVEVSSPPKAGEKRNLTKRGVSSLEMLLDGGKSKRTRLNSPSCRNNKFVWTAQTNAGGHQNTSQHKTKRKLNVGMSKFKWQRGTTTDTCGLNQDVMSDGVTMVTKTYGTIPAASFVSRKRRRSSSGSVNGRGLGSSPYIVKRYKMLRVSTLKNQGFSQRRLKYIIKQSSHSPLPFCPKKRRVSFSKSTPTRRGRNKVWRPQEEGERKGVEIKTRQGNKQWLSLALVEEKSQQKKQNKKMRKRNTREILIKGKTFVMTQNGKSIKRLSSTSSRRLSLSLSSVHKPSKSFTVKRMLANNVLQKSVNKVWRAKRNISAVTDSQYCLFYNRFGKCNRGENCKYIHDPKRIAICNKFLRGKCEKTDGSCPFSHNIAKEKMPVCSFFLRGICTRESCPYLHVSVGRDAEVCKDFVSGYCSLGDKCKKKHVLVCPDFAKDGICPRDKSCPLRHWKKTAKDQSNSVSVPAIKEPFPLKKLRRQNHQDVPPPPISSPSIITPNQLDFIPLDTSKVPEFIAL